MESKSGLPAGVRMEMLVGHMFDVHAAWDAQVKKLTVLPTHVRMRRDLEYIIEMNGAIYTMLVEVESHIQLLLQELKDAKKGARHRLVGQSALRGAD